LVDCIIGGSFIGVIGLIAIPSVSIVLMLMFSCLIVGGVRQWLFGTALTAASLAATVAASGTADSFQSPLLTSIVSIMATGSSICVSAYYSQVHARAVWYAKTQIQRQREQSIALSHKLSTSLSPHVWQSVFTGERDVRLESQRTKLAVVFSDIKG